ncbi:SCO family protein [Burkholderia lata]|uniref:SCO family protein n=2 Tax=Burkholderia TaxID=32008 RepID=UPI001E4C5557|nr:SCO family protein [Burkholderia lata]
MRAWVIAGAALATTPAWCAPDGSEIMGAGGGAAEGAVANMSATEDAAPDASESLMGKDMQKGVEEPVRTAVDSAADAAPPPAEHATEPAVAPAAAPVTGPAAEPATEHPAEHPAEHAPAAPTGSEVGKTDSHMTEGATEAAGMHMHHAVMPGTVHTIVRYAEPSVQLVRDDGQAVSLVKELDDGRPVFLTFIYTSCTTICPMVSQTLEQLQGELGADRDKVHIMSISVDPEADTPERLRTYAARFGAGPEWQHYTGTVDASVAAQRAFNVYRGDKMNHTPVTFVRAAPGQPWLRIDGFATPTELLAAYHDVVASN